MPQLQPLVLTDRSSPTALDHTFAPRDITGGVGAVIESTGTPIGDNRVTVSLVRTSGGRYKGTVNYTFPVVQMQTVNGVESPVILRTAYGKLEVTFDQTSTTSERNNVIGMIMSSLGADKVLVNDALVKLQGVY